MTPFEPDSLAVQDNVPIVMHWPTMGFARCNIILEAFPGHQHVQPRLASSIVADES